MLILQFEKAPVQRKGTSRYCCISSLLSQTCRF
uniref:Uncharacterized protein n=1 Tax=Anguilla anguilla TaxID=7936 RepID=A0A0E9WCD1_ANGAN